MMFAERFVSVFCDWFRHSIFHYQDSQISHLIWSPSFVKLILTAWVKFELTPEDYGWQLEDCVLDEGLRVMVNKLWVSVTA